MNKLKPCPFCGGKPVTSSLRTIIECFCFAQPAIEAHTPHDAAEEWNTRADSAELTAANARIAELEEALEPFAREADTFGSTFPDGLHPICDDEPDPIFRATFTIGDLRRAAALLEKK